MQTNLATAFGLAVLFSDCTILSTCPCKAVHSRYIQTTVVGCLQLVVCVFLGLSFTVTDSDFCKSEWTNTDDVALPNDGGGDSFRCTLGWGGICVAVAVSLWALAGTLTIVKAKTDRREEARKEQKEAEAVARNTIASGGDEKGEETNEMLEGI